eukprot:scaffold22197_cov66-Attheya_sp.AAC.1
MVLRPGGGGDGDDGERRCIHIVEGGVLDFVSLQYQFCTAAHVEAALLLFHYSQISRRAAHCRVAWTPAVTRCHPCKVYYVNPYQKRDVPETTLHAASSLLSLTPPMITPMKRSHPTLHGAPSSVQSNKPRNNNKLYLKTNKT